MQNSVQKVTYKEYIPKWVTSSTKVFIKVVIDKISHKEINLYRFRIRGKKFTFFWILVVRNNS